MRQLFVLLFLSLLLRPSLGFAWGLKDLGDEAAGPVTTDAKYALIGGTAATVLLTIFQNQIGDPFDEQQVRSKPLGDSSRWGDIMGQLVPNALYVGGMAISGYYGNPQSNDRALGMFKATAYSSAVTTVLKYSIREPRPNDHSTRNSFPSGHSTTVFAFSGFVTAEHGWGWGSAALLLSTFTGFSRINDNKHRLHDVVAGATIGWTYGWAMSRKIQKAENEAFIMPILDTKTAGLSLYKEF